MLTFIFAALTTVTGCGLSGQQPCAVTESRRATCEPGYVLVMDQAMTPMCAKAPLKPVNWR